MPSPTVRPDPLSTSLIIVDTEEEPREIKLEGKIIGVQVEDGTFTLEVQGDGSQFSQKICVKLAENASIFLVTVSDEGFSSEKISLEDLEEGMEVDAYGRFFSESDHSEDSSDDADCFIASDVLTSVESGRGTPTSSLIMGLPRHPMQPTNKLKKEAEETPHE